MSTGIIVIIVVVAIVVIIAIAIWAMYNGLVRARVRVQEAWSGIDVQLRRRASLIPNLVETVKGYAKHEREVFENVTKARAALMGATDPRGAAEANNMLTGALKSLFAVAEAYPELKASENFKKLQSDLTDTEDKIAYSRQFYNTNVLDYNTRIKVFPTVILAGAFGFQPSAFFEADEAGRAEVKVNFS